MPKPDAHILELASRLASIGDFGPIVAVEPLRLTSSNRNVVLSDRDGNRCVLRVYRQQPPPHTARVRLRRERWAYDVLASVGAPVPRVLASSEEAHREAVLLEFVEGEPLGTLAPDLSPAWHAAGRALARVHTVNGPAAMCAGCEQVGIRASTASRGPYHYDQALANLAQLAGARSDLPVLSLGPLIESARPLYDSAPLALCQYDTHLWQFLLVEESGRWRCSAILDWEHADLDDPDWDLAQLDVFRFAPTGPVPPAFFEGYGRRPRSPLYELYRLERLAWLLHAHARGVGWVGLSVPLAEARLHELLAEPARLQDDIESALAALG